MKTQNVKRKGIIFAITVMLSVVLSGADVYAQDGTFSADTSGNLFAAGETVDLYMEGISNIGNELFTAGMSVNADNIDVDGSIFAAAQDMSVKNSTVGGSIFAAGQNVNIDALVKNNIFAVGSKIVVGPDTGAKSIIACGSSASVSGVYDSVVIVGDSIKFNGVVTGDCKIEAEKITFGDDALVMGELKVTSSSEPKGVSKVANGTYEFDEIKHNTEQENGKGGLMRAAGKATLGAVIFKKIKSFLGNIFKYALLSIVFLFVFRKHMEKSCEYAMNKPAYFWGFGALILITFPLIAIILCFTVIGLPVAGLFAMFYTIALLFARVFTFTTLGRELIFTHTPKRLHPVLEVVICALLAAFVKEIPFIGKVVGFACGVYVIGYICMLFVDTVSANSNGIIPEKKVREK